MTINTGNSLCSKISTIVFELIDIIIVIIIIITNISMLVLIVMNERGSHQLNFHMLYNTNTNIIMHHLKDLFYTFEILHL